MKKIVISEKAKKIIAWIMLVIMGIFSAIGILTCLSGIYSCTTKSKTEVKKVYADTITQNTYVIAQGLGFNGTEYGPTQTAQENSEIIYYMDFELRFVYTGAYFNVQAKDFNGNNRNIIYMGEWSDGTNSYYEFQTDMTWLDSGAWGTMNYMHINVRKTTQYSYVDNNSIVNNNTPKPQKITYIGKAEGDYTFEARDKVIKVWGENNSELALIVVKSLPDLSTSQTAFQHFPCNLNTLDMQIIEKVIKEETTENAYNDGYNNGYKDGNANKEAYGAAQREAGKQEGIAQANDYSFTSLISAVFDVPIQTLFGMLNFNILGVNVLTFITSILSIILLVFIIKLILGG